MRLFRLLLMIVVGSLLYPFVALAELFTRGVKALLYALATEDLRKEIER